ncbi:MAG TPA: acetyl/propionyl/methylcrotonyl-CoA carboxylase subunit alpha [Allosphingosinicella sp.]|nr:acetyl/propionyl/methylcrotonyl-CoA carboxylase subunit alpha [Allosphingosinicella sp.]
MFSSVLIANRGEIACRIARTAVRLGMRTIAVYSQADAGALHVRQCDEAHLIGPAPAAESYLVIERIIDVARKSGAQCIHPGYGFLSENADFSEACANAGIVFVGPPPSAIRAMGLKDRAKALMEKAGVPVVPGYHGERQDPALLKQKASEIGYPVLIKAVAGGGGKGMRRVETPADFDLALEAAQREAKSSFGDTRVLIEKYASAPRHIELQVFADTHGNAIHLNERDCSLQRRHQKVIEEAPAPGMDEATRAAICEAAVKAAKAVGYVGAGTVEFIADASEGLRADRIWFMEMNTRLQVEHPVTEEITGQDLVEWQLLVASGEALPKRQEELAIDGWAIEARLYAEDPQNGFLPSIGPLDAFHLAKPESGVLRVRYDVGFDWDDVVTPHYDPMLGKVIVHGANRGEAIDELIIACRLAGIWPVRTNLGFVSRCLDHPLFRSGEIDTAFIPAHLDELLTVDLPLQAMAEWAVGELLPDLGIGPWEGQNGFRLNARPSADVRLTDDRGERYSVDLLRQRDAILKGQAFGGWDNVVQFEGEFRAFALESVGGEAGQSMADGAITSPMPGKLIAVEVRQGDAVTKGQKLVTLEAMKMEHSLVAPFDGIVAELNAKEGAQVGEGALLARIEKGEG